VQCNFGIDASVLWVLTLSSGETAQSAQR